MGRNGPLPHFQVLLRVEEHRFLELLRVRQEKVDREGAPVIEQLCGPVKKRTFAAIGSPFVSLGEVEEQLCRSPGLAHRYPQSPSSRLYALPRCFDLLARILWPASQRTWLPKPPRWSSDRVCVLPPVPGGIADQALRAGPPASERPAPNSSRRSVRPAVKSPDRDLHFLSCVLWRKRTRVLHVSSIDALTDFVKSF
jgi:hypothetical protein